MTQAAIEMSTFRELQATAGGEFVVELVDTFLEEAPGMLAVLRESRAAGDAEAFRRAAHSLKSNSLTFGALALAGQARALELGGLAAASGRQLEELAASYAAAAAELKGLTHA